MDQRVVELDGVLDGAVTHDDRRAQILPHVLVENEIEAGAAARTGSGAIFVDSLACGWEASAVGAPACRRAWTFRKAAAISAALWNRSWGSLANRLITSGDVHQIGFGKIIQL